MTKEGFIQMYSELQNEVFALKSRMDSLRDEYAKTAIKFKRGEKVVIQFQKLGTNITESEICFVRYSQVLSNGEIDYSFCKCKKDGTESTVGLYVYGSITSIEPYKVNS